MLETNSVVPLTSNMRVVGLPRKSSPGYRFYVVDANQIASRNGSPKGFATLLTTSKDGKVTAQLDSGGTCISFHTKNKVVWPVAPAGNPNGLKQPRKTKKAMAALKDQVRALNRRAR